MKAFWRCLLVLTAVTIAIPTRSVTAMAQGRSAPGVTDTEIKIGQTMPYSGPAAAYAPAGFAMKAYFKMLNAQGGINGRKVNLISLDNSYSPPKALEGARRLVEQELVWAIVGNLGTPTTAAIQTYLQQAHVPNLAVISGAGRFNDPARFPWTTPAIQSYRTEGRVYGKYLLQSRPEARIAVLYQNDDLGRDYLAGLTEGLGARAKEMIVGVASYEVTDPTIDSQIITLHSSGADVLVEFDSPKPASQAIRKMYEIGWHPTHIVSVTGALVSSVLKPAGAEKSAGIITASAGMDPSDPQWSDNSDVRAFHDFMHDFYSDGDPNSILAFVGYSVANVFAQIVRRCGGNLSREHLVESYTHPEGVHFPILIPGIALSTSSTDYDVVKQLQLFRFDGEHFVPFGEFVLGQ
jgi:branched-chain amino acid transport system substrate-binding protein